MNVKEQREDVEKMIESITINEEYLSDWEAKFIEDMEYNLSEPGYVFTARQIEKIWQIQQKVREIGLDL